MFSEGDAARLQKVLGCAVFLVGGVLYVEDEADPLITVRYVQAGYDIEVRRDDGEMRQVGRLETWEEAKKVAKAFLRYFTP